VRPCPAGSAARTRRAPREVDLRLSISEGHDRLILNGLAQADTITAGTADILTSVRGVSASSPTAGHAAGTRLGSFEVG
jgi:hypothetical protein